MSDDLRPYQLDRPTDHLGRARPGTPTEVTGSEAKSNSPKRALVPSTERTFLTVKSTIGVSALSNMEFDVQGLYFVYTAGTGVVLTQCGVEDGLKQRYYCMRNTDHLSGAFESFQVTSSRDGYGFPLQTQYLGISEECQIDSSPPKLLSPIKERAKSTTAVALRSDGRLLAVGETGHSPRISIFSCAPDADSSCPMAAISQHSFGVRFLRWSPCGSFLASLGALNDGYLHIWQVHDKGVRLHSSNKCIAQVEDMRWLSDRVLITVGDHHVRVWRVEDKEGGPQTVNVLSGRNPVMGVVNNVTCTSVCPVNRMEAVIGSKDGLVAILNVAEDTPRLTVRWQGLPPITALCVSSEGGLCIAFGGKIALVSIDEVLQDNGDNYEPIGTEVQQSSIVSLGEISTGLLCLSSNRVISLVKNTTSETMVKGQQGVIKGLSEPQLFWTAESVDCEGTSFKPELCQMNDKSDNEVSFALFLGEYVAIGDRSGKIGLYENGCCIFSTQAHQADITGMVYHEGLLLTSSRDRTIQVFSHCDSTLELKQTIVGHTANILKLAVAGQRLYSCSSDRSVGVHALVGGVWAPLKSISLKSSPLDMTLVDNELIVACSDKQIYVYRADKCELIRHYKCVNSRGDGLSVTRIVMGRFQHGGVKKDVLVSTCTDKSMRLFDHSNGALLASEWGHSDGVSGLILKSQTSTTAEIVTSGADGCLFVWLLRAWIEPSTNTVGTSSPTVPVARKVISKLELSSIARENNLDAPNSPVLRPSMLRKGVVDCNGSPRGAMRSAIRGKETPSPVRNDKPVSPARPKSPIRISAEKSPVRAGSSGSLRGGGSPRAGAVSVETLRNDLCVRLKRFRAEFENSEDREKGYGQLREELEATLEVLKGEEKQEGVSAMPDIEVMVREFGDKIYSLVAERLNGNDLT